MAGDRWRMMLIAMMVRSHDFQDVDYGDDGDDCGGDGVGDCDYGGWMSILNIDNIYDVS